MVPYLAPEKKEKKEKKMMIMLKQTTERPATPHNTELAASVVSKPDAECLAPIKIVLFTSKRKIARKDIT